MLIQEGYGAEPRESGSVIGADRRRSGPSRVLPKGVPQGQREILAAKTGRNWIGHSK